MANLFNNRLQLATVSGTNIYTVTGADGSVNERSPHGQSFPVGFYTRERPYLGRFVAIIVAISTRASMARCRKPDYGEVRASSQQR